MPVGEHGAWIFVAESVEAAGLGHGRGVDFEDGTGGLVRGFLDTEPDAVVSGVEGTADGLIDKEN